MVTADVEHMQSRLVRTKTPGVYKRGTRYVAVYRCDGRQRKQTVGSYAEARRIKAQHDAARPSLQNKTPTLEEHAHRWLGLERRLGRMRVTSIDDYERRLRRWVLPSLGHRNLVDLRHTDVSEFIAGLNEARTDRGVPLGDATIGCIVGTLRSCLSAAVREGLITTNPASDVRLRRRSAVAERQIPTASQLAAFIEAVDAQHRLFFEVMAVTGLRVSEATGLQWRDIEADADAACLVVNRAWVRGREHAPKSINGFRRVPIGLDIAGRLTASRRGSKFNDPNAFIFCSSSGRPLDLANLRRRVLKPAACAAGVPNLGFHDLRHYVASQVFARSNAKVAQVFLGHHSPDFTLKRYVHLTEGNVLQAVPLPRSSKAQGTPTTLGKQHTPP